MVSGNRFVLLVVAGAFVVAFTGLSFLFYDRTEAYALREAEKQVTEMLLGHRAVHAYVAKVQRPEFYRLKETGRLYREYFAPEVMSFTFIARGIKEFLNEERRREGLPEIYFKLATANPRNPINRADAHEQRLLERMDGGELTSFREVLEVEGRKYLYVALPVDRSVPACMVCHGNPADAPAELVARYGDTAGFNEAPGIVRALISVRVPLADSLAEGREVAGWLTLATLVVLSAVFALIVVFLRREQKQHAVILVQNQRLSGVSEELERSNSELRQFAYAISHDLQEPLRMVSSYVRLIERRLSGNTDPELVEFLGFAAEGSQRMHRMIADLLEYSRVHSQGAEMMPFAIRAAIEEALINLRLSIEQSEARLDVGDMPTVTGDSAQLVRLFQNLIGNALKYRAAGRRPEIVLRSERQDDTWVFSVRDNGIGMRPEDTERIFGVFQRLHTRDAYEGSGIGLALCRRIVERHGGRIWAESRPDQGSTFRFTLPVT